MLPVVLAGRAVRGRSHRTLYAGEAIAHACPYCGLLEQRSRTAAPTEDGAAIRRRRQCEDCGARYYLRAYPAAGDRRAQGRWPARTLRPRKADAQRQIACRKRPIDGARIDDDMGIQRQLETSGDNEVRATQIGAMVMEALKGFDNVAYIRFASVYRDLQPRFEEFASSITEAAKQNDQRRIWPSRSLS